MNASTIPTFEKFAPGADAMDKILGLTNERAAIKDSIDTSAGPGGAGATGTVLAAIRNLLEAGLAAFPVVNRTGFNISAGSVLTITGVDDATGRFKIAKADNTDATKPAFAVAHLTINDGDEALIASNIILSDVGPDTSGATVGVPLYLSTAGDYTVASPGSGFVQVVGYVSVKGDPGSVRFFIRAPSATVATDAAAVHAADYNANTILAATADNTPTARTVAEQTVVGRLTGGAIKALTVAELQALASCSLTKVFSIDYTDIAAATNALVGPTFPLGTVIRRAMYFVDTTFTSGTDAATIGIGFATDDPAGIVATTAISAGGNPWDEGAHEGISDGAAANVGERLSADRQLQIIRGGAEVLTAGKMLVVLDYFIAPA